MKRAPAGQILIGALFLLFVLAIAIPVLISHTQNESFWTVKQQRTTGAFALAESALEQGYQQFIISTTTWQSVQAGTIPSGYNFNQTYKGSGGEYEIRIASGPGAGHATVTGVARDVSKNEIRSLQAVYAVPGAANAVVYALSGASVAGNPNVEWGPVITPGAITATAKTYPRFYSSAGISGWDANPAPPNTDNVHWWAYQTLPASSQIDLEAYRAAAYSIDGAQPLGSGPPGSIYYYSGDLDPGANHFIDGDLIVLGSLNLAGNYGNGTFGAAPVPPVAWKEYGKNAASWSHFRTAFDAAANPTFPGLTDPYTTTGKTIAMNKVFIHGFLYVGNALTINASAQGNIYGSLYSGTTADLGNSTLNVYFDPNIIPNIKVKNNLLVRASWQELHCSWSAANPTCP
jgi:hypothetical protein